MSQIPAVICADCWIEEHEPPDDPDRRARYKAEFRFIYEAEAFYEQSRYDAHREAWALTGDHGELDRMLRHVR